MYVKENVKDEVYKKVIGHFLNKCDVVSFTYRPDQHSDNTQKIKKILSELNYSQSYIERNYSYKLISEFFKYNKDNALLFNDEYQNTYKKYLKGLTNYSEYKRFQKDSNYKSKLYVKYDKYNLKIDLDNLTYEEYKTFIIYDNRLDYIWSIFSRLYYEYKVNEFINKYKKNILYERKNYDDKSIISIQYFFKIDENLKKRIIRRNSVFDWSFPNSIEDMTFYSKGLCKLFSIAHEKILNIFCENEDEYKYLNLIGVKFNEEIFVPVKEKDKIFEKYQNLK